MAQTQINGGTQIQSGTITLDRLVTGYTIPTANLVDGANFLKKDGSVTVTGTFNFGGFEAQNALAPTTANSLTTRAYVDAKTGGIGGWHSVRIYAAANIASLSGFTAIDGVTPVDGDIILAGLQTTGSQSGPWVAHSGAWTRPTWWPAAGVVNEGQYFLIAEGTTYKDTKFFCTNTGTITVDTTSTTFSQDTSGVTYTNGTGLSLTGTTFAVLYGSSASTAVQGNDARVPTSLATGVNTALGVAVGSAGAFVVNGGALGTPSGGTLTNATGLPIAGITGVGTGVATALAANTNAGSGLLTLTSGLVAAAQFPALTGDVTNTAGSLATTINHTSGSGFLKYTDFIINETPSGTVNSSNTSFTLANTPGNVNGGTGSLELTLNGEVLEPGSGNDYTISAATITMLFAPSTGSKLRAFYIK